MYTWFKLTILTASLVLMKVDPRLKNLRSEVRYQELERRMAFP